MGWYGLFIERQMEGATKTDFLTGAFNCLLHTATYTPNNDTDDFWNDATNEVTGTNYTTKGVVLGSKTSVYDTATDEWRFDAADAVWTTATIASIRYAVVFERRRRIHHRPPSVVLRSWRPERDGGELHRPVGRDGHCENRRYLASPSPPSS